MANAEESENEKRIDLEKFVERIANLFETRSLSQMEMREKRSKKLYLVAYLLREIPSRAKKASESDLKKGHSFIRVIPDYEFEQTLQKNLDSSAQGAHRLTLKQNLHFDAFKQLLLEKGLMVKNVIDWKIHNPGKATIKIREWGKTYSSVRRDPSFVKRVCIITRKSPD